MDSSAAVAHRRIELQDPEDFTYLIDNVRRAAADSINAAFPPVEGAEGEVDELRERIEELVNEVRVICVSRVAVCLGSLLFPVSFLLQSRCILS